LKRYRAFTLRICDAEDCHNYGGIAGMACHDEGHAVAVEYVPATTTQGAVSEIERLRAALRDLKSLMPAITGNAEEVVRRVDQELAPPTTGGQ
jgi:hypothetical protein